MPNADLNFNRLWGVKETPLPGSRSSKDIGLCTFDRDRRYRTINKMLAGINGERISAHLGHVVDDVLPSHRAMAVNDYPKRILSGGNGIRYELEKCGNQQTSAHFLVSMEPIRNRRNIVTGVACIMEHMTAS